MNRVARKPCRYRSARDSLETMNESDSAALKTMIEQTGFAIVPNVLDDPMRRLLIERIDELNERMGSFVRSGIVYALRDLLNRIVEVRDLASSHAVRSIVEPILGPEARVVRGLMFDKRSEANWGVPWHQDLTIAVTDRVEVPGFTAWTLKAEIPHVQPPGEFLSRMLTLRIHLDADSTENGPLRVIPGSHATGRLDATATRDWIERVAPVTCLVPERGVLIMRPLILHSSSASISPTHRRVIHLEFAAESLPEPLIWYEDHKESVA